MEQPAVRVGGDFGDAYPGQLRRRPVAARGLQLILKFRGKARPWMPAALWPLVGTSSYRQL
jgi:hypothetical protein